MIDVDEAHRRLFARVEPGPTIEMPLRDALYRTSAAPVRTDMDSPPFDRSVMDGYAAGLAQRHTRSSGDETMATELRQASWVASVNALGKGLGDDGRSVISLASDSVMSAAKQNTGLDDFGEDDWFVEPLQALCSALEKEAQLTLLGRLMARHEIQVLLQNRLMIEDTLKRNPQILDEEIANPIFVWGLGRSGTTVLHELLSEDPAHRVPQLWEMWHVGSLGCCGGTSIVQAPAKRNGGLARPVVHGARYPGISSTICHRACAAARRDPLTGPISRRAASRALAGEFTPPPARRYRPRTPPPGGDG